VSAIFLLFSSLCPLAADCNLRRPLNLVYVHFRSRELEKMQSQGDFWYMVILNGGIVVAQDKVDIYTLLRMVPPGVNIYGNWQSRGIYRRNTRWYRWNF